MSQEKNIPTNNVREALEYIWCYLNIYKGEYNIPKIWNECLRLANCSSDYAPKYQLNNIS